MLFFDLETISLLCTHLQLAILDLISRQNINTKFVGHKNDDSGNILLKLMNKFSHLVPSELLGASKEILYVEIGKFLFACKA